MLDPRRLKLARIAAGHPIAAAAARRCGMLPQHLIRLERGGRDAKWTTMTRLIAGLDLGLEWFFDENQILDSADRIRAERLTQRKGRTCS